MNPIKTTFITLVIWAILTVVYVYITEKICGGDALTILFFFYYLAPFVGLISFIISLFYYRFWVSGHKTLVATILTVLITWILYILIHIRSLFV